MKKLLSIAAVAALLSTGAMADNKITITGEVLSSAVVGFAAVNTEDLGTDKFIDATMDLGAREVNAFNTPTATNTASVYVKTNVAAAAAHKVTMAITAPKIIDGVGQLVDTVSGETIPAVYTLGTAEFDPTGVPLDLTDAANNGDTAITTFTVTTNAANDQLAGTYGTVLTVAIVAN